MESVLARVYAGGWPARAVRAIGMQGRVRSVEHRVGVAGWRAKTAGAAPLRIAFASDFHAGPTTHPSLLDEALDAVVRAAPDVLLLGGDYVFLDARGVDELASRFARVRAPLGRFAVMGNHDLWADDARIRRALEGAGVRVLVNESVALPAPYDRVSIVGLDDPWTGLRDAPRALAGAPRDAVRVVLMHAPEGLLELGSEPFDLALCGHTHGGHLALPGGVPIVMPGPLGRRYPHGRFEVGGRTLIVSRGVGATESALRLFAPPDVRLVALGQ